MFNKLPLASSTPSTLNKKSFLESKLKELERNITTFSYKKVYVSK
jgi:hypothetical protein